MKFELDDILIDQILFYMENQDGDFVLDAQEGLVVDIFNHDYAEEPDFSDRDRFFSLPQWSSADGYRLMEKFAAEFKNPVVRQELSAALNRSRGVFRAFKNVLEQYPEAEKLWFNYKDQKMKNEVIDWYNSLREEWGLEPVGSEPEDTSSLILEDFIIKEEKNPDYDFYFSAQAPDGTICGQICAKFSSPSQLHIHQLEVKPEYRGLGLGKTLLEKFLEKTAGNTITVDLPAETDFFSRSLHLEGFKPCSQRFILNQ